MDRLIPRFIEELEYLNSLSSKYEPLVAYYKEFGTIANIKQIDIYSYQGREVHIGRLIFYLRRLKQESKLTPKEIDLLNSIGMIWEYDRLAPLKAYYNEFGTIANIKSMDIYNYQGKEVKIGRLINSLRVEYNKGKLDLENVDQLNSMGMIWQIIDKNNRLAPLVAYYNEFGTLANIKFSEIYKYNGQDVKIGSLINNLRNEYQKGILNNENIELLNNMGMIWTIRERFDDKLLPLIAYYEEFGTIADIRNGDVYNYKGKEVKIGVLIANLRRPERKAKLTEEEIELLNSMGMVWRATKTFKDRITPLVSYYNEFGTIGNIKFNEIYKYNGQDVKIGELINSLRKEYKNGKLTQVEINKLELMGMVWCTTKTFEERIAPLRAYYNEFGTISIINASDVYCFEGKDVKIGSLINHLRVEYGEDKLSNEQVNELQSLGMVWELRVRFKDRLAPFKAYYKEFGSLSNIKFTDVYYFADKDVKIGELISSLRKEYKKGILNNETIELLNSMGMIWDATFRKNIRNRQANNIDNDFKNDDLSV